MRKGSGFMREMREHVKVEVAIEIISMCIAIAIDNNDIDEIKKLNNEKERIYLGDEHIIEKVIKQYGSKVKRFLED